MILRNGLLSALRAKGRTALFTLLLLLLTVSLTLGLGMWAYCAGVLSSMDENYTSVALVEYMGIDYPDPDSADEYARRAAEALDGGALSAVDGVKLWERADTAMALLDGYERSKGTIPYQDYGVAVISGLSPYYQTGWGTFEEEGLSSPCVVRDSVSGDMTLYAPELEPLKIPSYYQDETGYYRFSLSDDGSWERLPVAGEDLPEFYWLSTDTDSGLIGELPDAYLPYSGLPDQAYTTGSACYYYDPVAGTYTGFGDILAGYNGVASVIYTQDGKSSFVGTFELSGTGLKPEYGKRYLVHGKFVQNNSNNLRFAVTDFYEGCETPPWLELSGLDDPALTDSLFLDYADYYRLANNYAQVEASADVAALEVFQQGVLYLAEGRFPGPGEAGVCVLSGYTAVRLGKTVGDTVDISLLASDPQNKYSLSEAGGSRTLEIVGVTNILEDYEGWLWVSDAEGGFGSPLFGYTLGRAVLDNAAAREAADALQALVPDAVRVTLYDQGYTAAAQPLETMRATAAAVTTASALGALVVLVLFAFLFVGRQRETVGILLSLGTPNGKIRLWLLSGAAAIAAFSALLGAAAGGGALKRVIQAALAAAQSLYAVDTRYSEAAIGLVKESQAAAAVPLWPAAAAGSAVFLAALLLCLAFLRQACGQSAPKKGRLTVRVPKGGTSVAGRGAPRFAMLSAKRGGWRSAVVPAASLALALLLGILAAGVQGWEGQLDQLYQNTRLQGQLVSTNGRSSTGLQVSAETTQTLWQSGLLDDISVSIGWHYWLPGEMPAFSNSSFGEESRAAWIAAQPSLVALNALAAAPEFYYSGAPEITWLEGWDGSFLAGNEYASFLNQLYLGSFGGEMAPVYPALVSSRFLTEHGLELGDTFNINFEATLTYRYNSTTVTFFAQFQAVGSFVPTGSGGSLYVPLSFWMDPAYLTGERELPRDGAADPEDALGAQFYSSARFGACRFTLASARDLEAFRGYLAAQNFSQVGLITRNRVTVLLRDQTFTETVGGLGRYITFSRLLFPVLLVLVGLLGFVISWLMVNGRRMEFAIMRGLGASRRRVFASFFLEQAALCLAGCLIGALALSVFRPGWAVWLAAAGFLACYLAGCALSVLAVGRTRLMALLSERE